jgi:CubicO group peptidase (beta-lactamase class C family)
VGFRQAVYDSGAFGWDGGLGTSWLVDPSQDLTVIVLTQRMFERPDPPQVHRDPGCGLRGARLSSADSIDVHRVRDRGRRTRPKTGVRNAARRQR